MAAVFARMFKHDMEESATNEVILLTKEMQQNTTGIGERGKGTHQRDLTAKHDDLELSLGMPWPAASYDNYIIMECEYTRSTVHTVD